LKVFNNFAFQWASSDVPIYTESSQINKV